MTSPKYSASFPLNSSEPIRILVCDDHDMIRQAIVSLLYQQPYLKVVGDVANGIEVMEFLQNHPVDVVLLDLEMPEMNGTETAEQIAKQFPDTKVLVLSAHNDEFLIANLLVKGIHGFVFKKNDKNELLHAIQVVASGKKYFADDIMDLLLNNFKQPNRSVSYKQGIIQKEDIPAESDEVSQFTQREKDVLQLLAQGMNSQEISEILEISVHTVDAHKRNMFKKAQVHSGVALIRYAMEKGILQIQ
jgi:DNA-binding NarL/FixJ family response regulator